MWFEHTEYPSVYKHHYWGRHRLAQPEAEIIDARNEFARCRPGLKGLNSVDVPRYVERYSTNATISSRRFYDHIEYYKHGPNYLIVNSPSLGQENKVTEELTQHGWLRIPSMYHPAIPSFLLIVVGRARRKSS